MEKEEAKSKWDELARQIGAEISPEVEQVVEPATPQPSSGPTYSPPALKKQERAPAKRPAAGWDNLASEFGLPVPEPVEPPAVKERSVAVSQHIADARAIESEKPRPERHEERPQRERQPRQPRDRQRTERHARDREESEHRPSGRRSRGRRSSEGDRESREEKPRRGGRDRSERHERRRESPPRDVEEREPLEHADVVDQRREEREPQREAPQEPPKPAPAVSLWQKIFGTPADPPKPIEPAARETRGAEPDDVGFEGRYESSPGEDNSSQSTSRADVDESDVFSDRSSADVADELDEVLREERSEQRERRPRHRRRGRGGRGDKRQERRTADTSAGDGFDTEDDALEESAGEDADAGVPDENVASGNGAERGERSGRGRSVLQRSIPSWDEAIGYIVDLNMQARSQRRPSSQSGSQRGRSRGRRNR